MTNLTRNGTGGRVYGGDDNLVHIQDGQRHSVGVEVARDLDGTIRRRAGEIGKESVGKSLCPGCYMVALFNAAVVLANTNGQPLSELGATMANAFSKLAQNPTQGVTEEIEVILDPEEWEGTIPWGPFSPWTGEISREVV